MKKIAVFTDTYFPDVNGVARTLKRLTNYFECNNIQFRVFAPESTRDSFFEQEIYRFTSLPFFLYPECRMGLPNLSKIKQELLAFQPELIHIATPFNIGLTGLHFAKKLDIPVVGSYHTDFDRYLEYYDLQFLSRLLWKYMHWFHASFQKLFVPSNETYHQLKRHGFTNLSIWPRGVDCNQFHPYHNKAESSLKYQIDVPYVLTYVGRLAPEKNIDTLIKIATSLPPSINDKVHWLIVGEGPSMEEMRNQAPSNMTFTGYLSGKELSSVYAYSDLFIFPSTTETFGNVVLESLASGTPVIGANAGGVKDIIQHDCTGVLCNPNQINEYIEAISKLICNTELRKKMESAGRRYALTQSWGQIFSRLVNEYDYVLSSIENRKYA
ncbi:glycosyltransferase family 4 protein [Litchfieldia alkalitelluris]|uniref:glycosyltransferase family 4 protein n=1 Tax=Litchfieldia alkalitelluris TaxID=304268 RepID=UPI000996D6D9|nr:glycosyltransferase family 1 protein [Litchfieldia alkalitelluris]